MVVRTLQRHSVLGDQLKKERKNRETKGKAGSTNRCVAETRFKCGIHKWPKQIYKQMVVRRYTVLSCLGSSGGQGNGCGSFLPRQPTRWWPAASLNSVPMCAGGGGGTSCRYMCRRALCAKKVWGPNRLYTGPPVCTIE